MSWFPETTTPTPKSPPLFALFLWFPLLGNTTIRETSIKAFIHLYRKMMIMGVWSQSVLINIAIYLVILLHLSKASICSPSSIKYSGKYPPVTLCSEHKLIDLHIFKDLVKSVIFQLKARIRFMVHLFISYCLFVHFTLFSLWSDCKNNSSLTIITYGPRF